LSDLKGIVAPFTTPFTEDGAVDLALVAPQVDWLIDNGVHGLAAGGSTGEGHVLDRAEYCELIKATADAVDNRVPLVAGIIANSTAEVAARGLAVKQLGIAALQITPPHYLFRPDDDAMVGHFQEIQAKCDGPILIYNVVPWCYLSPDLLLRIMDEVPGVLGVKQSAGDMKLFADLVRRAKPENLIFSAVDAMLYPSYQLGARGSIAAILTAAPGPSVRLWNAVIDQDWETARDLHERLMPLWDAIGVDNMPSLVKYAQHLQGLDAGHARKPTSPATEAQKQLVYEALEFLGLIAN
jgi:4-hydroxy-tetrahydrodipicolinate synthase